MADGTETTGTPTPQPQDGNAQATGTAGLATDGGNAGDAVDWRQRAEDLERKFQQSLVEKQNLEDERRRRQDLEWEVERLKSGGYGTAPATAGNPYAEAAAQMQRNFLMLQQSDDPRDQMLVANINYMQQLESQQRFMAEMASIPPSEQQDVAARAKREGLSPSMALAKIKAEKYDAERGDFEARRKKLDEEEDARRRGRVDVSTTPIPARDLATGNYTPKMFAEDCEKAERGDPKARQRIRDFDEGRIKFSSP